MVGRAPGELAVPFTVGDRGGGFSPAQRRNLSPAHGDKPATYRSVLMGHSGAASGEPAAGGGSTVPARASDRGGGEAAPAQRRNLSPAHGSSANTYQGIKEAQGGGASGEHAAGAGQQSLLPWRAVEQVISTCSTKTPCVGSLNICLPTNIGLS